MRPLPYAPPPARGEGLSSWIARLAACNFVSTDEFLSWLGADPDSDIAPKQDVFQRLAGVSGLPIEAIARTFAACVPSDLCVARTVPSGIRGGACPQCASEALIANRSQFTHAAAQSVFRVTCPLHRRRLASLTGYTLSLHGLHTRFVQVRTQTIFGDTAMYPSIPGSLILRMEDAISRVIRNKRPGRGWRTENPDVFIACVNCLIDVVLWRGLKGSFAASFNDTTRGGGTSFCLRAEARVKGCATLTDQTPVTRLHVISALAALMVNPGSRYRVTTIENPFRLDDDEDPYWNLASGLRSEQMIVLAERLKSWPMCIAAPMIAGVLDTHGLQLSLDRLA